MIPCPMPYRNQKPRPTRRSVVWTLGRAGGISLPLLVLGLGCSIAPKTFRSLTHPSPIVRARAMGLGDNLPESEVIPNLIERLDDPDAVVRLTANEELRRRSGKDFGFVPWADTAERAPSVARWRDWWSGRKASLAKSGRIP